MSKVSYKLIYLDNLKKVDFHGKLVQPLYIQLTFQRKINKFKSALFDQLSKPRYLLHAGASTKAPSMDLVRKKEDKIIGYIIEKLGDSFTYEKFLDEYYFLTIDLCDATENAFNEFLRLHFSDEGMPYFARSLYEGNKTEVIYDVMADLKILMMPDAYSKLREAAYYSEPAYLLLYGFARNIYKWPVILPVMEWEAQGLKDQFLAYLTKYFPEIEVERVLHHISKVVKHLAKLKD